MSIIDMMTVTPSILPLHPAEFMAFARAYGSQENVLQRYTDETGNDLSSIVPRSAMDAAIDNVTGGIAAKQQIAKYLDWLAINYWGVEGQECED